MAESPIKRANTKSPEEYLAQLDELLKRNTGQGLFAATDATSNTPMYIPGKVQNPLGIEQSASSQFQLPKREAPLYPEIPDMPFEPPQGQVLGEQTSGPISITDFIEQLTNQTQTPQLPSTEQLDQKYQQTGQKYPVASLANGMVRFNDGSEGAVQGPAQPIASMTDGSVLWSDGFTRQAPPRNLQGQMGEQGLSQFIFGQNQKVTQDFGNVNPIEPTPGNVNLGTDFRTRDLQNRNIFLPLQAEVVEVLYDDGTRFGDTSGHQGYGNSVLLRLPTGEMLRLSHLSDMGDFEVGQVLNPGQRIGTPGTTGNTAGEHLDVEYYDQSGNIADPKNFINNAKQYSSQNQIVGPSPYGQQPQQSQQQSQAQPAPQPQQELSYPGQTINEGIVQPAVNAAKQAPQRAGQVLGETAQNAGVEADFGLSETLKGGFEAGKQQRLTSLAQQPKQSNPYRQLAGNVTERIGDTLGVPEGLISESIAGNTTKRTNQALANEFGGEDPEQIPGIRENISDIGSDLKNRASNVFAKNINSVKQGTDTALQAAGQGISNLKQGLNTSNIFKAKATPVDRAVGDDSANPETGSLMDGAPSLLGRMKNDIRDAFFKDGSAANYQEFLKPNAEQLAGGALTLDLFNDDFYKNQQNISSVFGNSNLAQPAQSRYDSYQAEQKRLEEARRAEEARRPQPTLDDYLSMGKTAAQYYAETGQQSTADRAGGADKAAEQSRLSVQQAQQSQSRGNPGSSSVTMPGGRVVSAPAGQRVYVDAKGQPQYVADTSVRIGNTISNFNTPVSDRSAQVNRGMPPQVSANPNIFSKAKTNFTNLFRR